MFDDQSLTPALAMTELIGIAGFMAYVAAFGSVQLGLMDGNGATYALLNVLAAALVLVSLTTHFNLASALIQCAWILFGTVGLLLRARLVLRRRSAPIRPEADR